MRNNVLSQIVYRYSSYLIASQLSIRSSSIVVNRNWTKLGEKVHSGEIYFSSAARSGLDRLDWGALGSYNKHL